MDECKKKEIVIANGRDFKGVWIPRALYMSREFSPNEKFLLIEIWSLSSGKIKQCYASNKHFADFIGLCENSIQKMLLKFEKSEYIRREYVYKDGTKEIEKRVIVLTNKFYDKFINEHESISSANAENKSSDGDGKNSIGSWKKFNHGDGKNSIDKYNNEKYNNEVIHTDALKEESFKDSKRMDASFPVEKEGGTTQRNNKSISKTDYTENELQTYLPKKLKELYIHESLGEDERLKDFVKIVMYFYQQYNNTYIIQHPILSDMSYRKIVMEYLCPPEIMQKYGEYSFEVYKTMIDKYFTVDFGRYSGTPENFNYRISHFFTEKILEHLYRQTQEL